MEKFYTVEEIAENLKVTKQTIYVYVRSGELKAIKVGKSWRVSEDNLKEFLSVDRKEENK